MRSASFQILVVVIYINYPMPRYEDLLSAFKSLKTQAQKSFAFVDEARITLASFKEVRERAIDTIKGYILLLHFNV
jgi:hypothetical protein